MKLNQILNIICTHFQVDERLVKSDFRDVKYTYPRQLYCYFAKLYTKETLENIGKLINRNHDTVIHSVKSINDRLIYIDVYFDVNRLHYEFRLTQTNIIVTDVNLLKITKRYTNSLLV